MKYTHMKVTYSRVLRYTAAPEKAKHYIGGYVAREDKDFLTKYLPNALMFQENIVEMRMMKRIRETLREKGLETEVLLRETTERVIDTGNPDGEFDSDEIMHKCVALSKEGHNCILHRTYDLDADGHFKHYGFEWVDLHDKLGGTVKIGSFHECFARDPNELKYKEATNADSILENTISLVRIFPQLSK
jgi:hypothetical protein